MKRRFAALLLCSCASLRDGAVVAVNATADIGEQTEHVLEQLDKASQEACLETSEPRACVLSVRVRFHTAWKAYRAWRLSWLTAAATVRAYDAAIATKSTADLPALLKATNALVESARVLADAVQKIGAQ